MILCSNNWYIYCIPCVIFYFESGIILYEENMEKHYIITDRISILSNVYTK